MEVLYIILTDTLEEMEVLDIVAKMQSKLDQGGSHRVGSGI